MKKDIRFMKKDIFAVLGIKSTLFESLWQKKTESLSLKEVRNYQKKTIFISW